MSGVDTPRVPDECIPALTVDAPETPRTSHISFALCFAALKDSVSAREDRTISLEVKVWAYNHIPDQEIVWSAWVGCLARSIIANTPESLISRVTAALEGRDTMTIEEVRT